jgi:hypothetical protein
MKIDYDAEIQRYSEKLDDMQHLMDVSEKLTPKDQEFASDLMQTFTNTGGLSSRQWEWVKKLADRVSGMEPIYGDFDAIRVMFMMAGEHIKIPKIRLLAESGRYVQLNFYPDTKTIKVYVDGWQGHGSRKFAGVIEKEVIKPFNSDRMTEEVKTVIQELSLDPAGVAKAMAAKLGCCSFCGSRLSDDESKRRGYGPTCAEHFGLPHGNNMFTYIEKYRSAK